MMKGNQDYSLNLGPTHGQLDYLQFMAAATLKSDVDAVVSEMAFDSLDVFLCCIVSGFQITQSLHIYVIVSGLVRRDAHEA